MNEEIRGERWSNTVCVLVIKPVVRILEEKEEEGVLSNEV